MRRCILPAGGFFLLAWLAASSFSGLPARAEELEAPTRPEIRAEDLRRHVSILASDAFEGRETTTAGERKAAAYLATELERFGCEEAGEDGTFFQPYAVPRPQLGAKNTLAVHVEDAVEWFAVETAWNPFSGTANTDAHGALVFAGYGITAQGRSWDDYAGVDVKGKVVLVLRKDPAWNDVRHAAFTAKLDNAQRHGAAALLLCNDGPTVEQQGGDRIHRWSEPMGGRAGDIPFAFVTREVAERLLAPLGPTLAELEAGLKKDGPSPRAIPGVTVDIETEITRTRKRNALNVVAWVRGRDPEVRHETVVIGGHYDHLGRGSFGSTAGAKGRGKIHPGADDNASGTAAVLEVAEYFARAENRPRRSLLFVAFSGEEMGLFGSSHYVAHPIAPLADTVLMINLDMVGRVRGSQFLIWGVGTAKGLRQVVESANEGEDLAISMSPSGSVPSDSLPFFRKKIPVLFFHSGMHRDYHRPSDTSDRINYAGLARASALTRDVVEAVANAPERLVFTQPPIRRRPPFIGIQLGPDDPTGVVVRSVTPGGPAATAGLLGGDIIVMLAHQSVRNTTDLRTVLGGLKAGTKVAIVVLRGEERVELEIAPMARGRRR